MSLVVLALAFVVAVVVVAASSEAARRVVARLAHVPLKRRFVFVSPHSSPGRKAGVLAAGPVGAYLGVVVLAFVAYSCRGVYSPSGHTLVGETLKGYDADGKLLAGDVILSVDGTPVAANQPGYVAELVNRANGAPVTLAIERAGARRDVIVQPRVEVSGGRRLFRIGIRVEAEHVWDTSLGTVVPLAFAYPFQQVGVLGDILVGREQAEPGGPVRIVAEYRDALPETPLWLVVVKAATLFGSILLGLLVAFDAVRSVLALLRGR